MITEWHDKEAEKIWNMKVSTKLPQDIQKIARRKLVMINAAKNLNDLRVPPANHLEELKGDRAGQHSIRINDQFRVCFYWNDGNVIIEDICDYH
ncbi:MAG: type II toxin-antitoxin system RelE/ParE family toxin [Lachnospiraceae bacterium]|jgi:proteic killer suppression protein|nr:type II toxin-antitoxin system RelE/ParE family toxin [Oribacterium sp.]MEE3462595.1 type II toxin-antitoxin system RelE/ParE family toxin [Lachnospiraceae bacterium]